MELLLSDSPEKITGRPPPTKDDFLSFFFYKRKTILQLYKHGHQHRRAKQRINMQVKMGFRCFSGVLPGFDPGSSVSVQVFILLLFFKGNKMKSLQLCSAAMLYLVLF